MQRALPLLIMVAGCAVGLLAPSAQAEQTAGAILSQGLKGFQLTCIVNAGNPDRCRPNGQALSGLPATLDPSKVYVFNKRLPGGVSDMATSELPHMLKQAGCKVESAPRSPRDFLFPDEGEPIFVIRLRCGGKSVELRNRFNRLISDDASLCRTWSVSDLTLKLR